MDPRLRYSTDKVAIVRAARANGMSDGEILLALCRGEREATRRRIVREWAAPLGLTAEEALAQARKVGIVRR
ncbi:MAG: hypothetical protein HYY06_32765 [Deltaproteobacteria bacterium]|nr:hypothetical protein [Deltaproteobacteria bacterium]